MKEGKRFKGLHPHPGPGVYSLDWERNPEGEKNDGKVPFTSFITFRDRLGAKRQEQIRKDVRELIRSYVTCSSECQRENEWEYHLHEWETSSERISDEPLESEDSFGGRH
ncbi:hypothetical protein Tco_0628782 [Tanacetum coccineum]|uniref:Uncharacterized protein n=1 Tax=Tanacetum coccineum TaxID=301880 RepID=A0ABQ4WR90_9ASTR